MLVLVLLLLNWACLMFGWFELVICVFGGVLGLGVCD